MSKVTLMVDPMHIQEYGYISDAWGETIHGVHKDIINDYENQGYTIYTQFIINPWLGCYEDAFMQRIHYGTWIVWAERSF